MEVNIQIPDEYLDDFIPKLILQPLVENVIKHAFADKEDKGFIGIVASEKEGKRLEITIFDNGKGIEKDTLQEICEKIKINRFSKMNLRVSACKMSRPG